MKVNSAQTFYTDVPPAKTFYILPISRHKKELSMKVLFITSRNVYSTSGELRLIKNRAHALKEKFNIDTDAILFRNKSILRTSQESLNVNSFEIITHRWVDFLWKKKILLQTIQKKLEHDDYIVVLSGIFVLSLVKPLKQEYPSIKMIADLHGAFEELIEFPASDWKNNLVRKLFYYYAKKTERSYLPFFNGYLSVSNALKKYIQTEYAVGNQPFFIIPCAISETEIDEEKAKGYRKYYREKYKIRDNELLFIYSGGTSPWQCISESVEIYNHIKSNLSHPSRLLLMSNNRVYLEQFADEDIIIDSYSGSEIRKVLCAGDYAFLIRQNFVTNHVAYPNKFLEYIFSGLRVIATDYVYDVAKQIKQYNLGVCTSSLNDMNVQIPSKTDIWLADIKERNQLLQQTSFTNTLRPFVQYIKA